jgi:hypothetical protein
MTTPAPLLKRVDFEHIEAERDPNLTRYFVQTESFTRIFRGQKMYVIGRKGTGKSSIYSAIHNMPSSPEYAVAGLTFDDYPWQLHNKIRDETRSVDSAHVITWRYIILIELAKVLLQEAEQKNSKSKDTETLTAFVEEAYGTAHPSLNKLLSGLVDRIKRVRKIELPGFDHTGIKGGSIEFDPKESPEKAVLATIKAATDTIHDRVNKLLSRRFYFVLFDKLDDGWDNSAEFKSSIVGLLRAARDLNIEAQKVDKLLRCVVFLRSDIYDSIQYNDKNKAFSDIKPLVWNEKSLLSLINKRIEKSLGLRNDANPWGKVFESDTMRSGTSNFKYITRRTLLRPRDLITFCQECKSTALKNDHDVILNSDVYEAEEKYSERVYREFVDEMHKQCPQVDKLFEVLRRLRFERFSFATWEAEFYRAQVPDLSPSDALRILFDYSIVGVVRIGGSGGGSTLEFKFTHPLIQLDYSREMVVHPGLKKHLKLIEKRSKATVSGSETEESFLQFTNDPVE